MLNDLAETVQRAIGEHELRHALMELNTIEYDLLMVNEDKPYREKIVLLRVQIYKRLGWLKVH
jgi:hypothetical protein